MLWLAYLRYKPEFFWWESAVLVRKLLVVILMRTQSHNVDAQAGSVAAVLIVAFALQLRFKPNMGARINRLEIDLSAICTFWRWWVSHLGWGRATVTAYAFWYLCLFACWKERAMCNGGYIRRKGTPIQVAFRVVLGIALHQAAWFAVTAAY